MHNYTDDDECPGFKFLCVFREERIASCSVRKTPILVNDKVCYLCSCASSRVRSNGKFSVKCIFDGIKDRIDKDKKLFSMLHDVWKLKLDLLDDKISAVEYQSVRDKYNLDEKAETETGDEDERHE